MTTVDDAMVEQIDAQYRLRDNHLSHGEHKLASSAHVEFHRLVYGHWPAIRTALTAALSDPDMAVPDDATHMRRPEYITAWQFDRQSVMPVWLIEKYKSIPLLFVAAAPPIPPANAAEGGGE